MARQVAESRPPLSRMTARGFMEFCYGTRRGVPVEGFCASDRM